MPEDETKTTAEAVGEGDADLLRRSKTSPKDAAAFQRRGTSAAGDGAGPKQAEETGGPKRGGRRQSFAAGGATALATALERLKKGLSPWIAALRPTASSSPDPEGPDGLGDTAIRAQAAENRRKRVLMALGTGAVVVVVALALNRGDESKSGAIVSPLAETGQIITQGDVAASVETVNDNYQPDKPELRAAPGRRIVAVKFKLVNESRRTIRIDAGSQFLMVDPANNQYKSNTKGIPDPIFKDGDLKRGDDREGWVSFEVPANGVGFRLVFTPTVVKPAS